MALRSISDGYRKKSDTKFFKTLDEKSKKLSYGKFCKESPSTSEAEYYEFMGGVEAVREFIGKREVHGFVGYDYYLKNRKWELTHGWDIDKVSDNPGIIEGKLPELSESYSEHPQILFIELLVNGRIRRGYDGKYFFATDHPSPREGYTYSNLLTGTGVTVAAIQADFKMFRKQILKLKKRNGHPLFVGEVKFEIIHPVDLIDEMEEAFLHEKNGDNENGLHKKAELNSEAGLEGNDWFVGVTNKEQKPFVHQVRQKPTSDWDETGKFDTDQLRFGVKGRSNMGYGHSQLCFMVTNDG
ncbi:MAG: hypothetical protein GY757_07800 [bacterium]|nr:hypothetical protein [bacterium]